MRNDYVLKELTVQWGTGEQGAVTFSDQCHVLS